MKAFLLAAGVGSRLRPLTDHTPKCLVEVGGQPMLGIWFELLVRHGIDEVLVNVHHLPERVEEYVARHAPQGLRVHLVREPVLLGSAGTVSANRDFVAGEREFFVLYADNLTDVDLADFRAFHAAHRSEFTMGLFETDAPETCGIATLDAAQRVVEFVEKPARPKSRLANAGLYLTGPALFDVLPKKAFADFGFDVLPSLVGRMYGYPIRQYFRDIGTLERLDAGRREWGERSTWDGHLARPPSGRE